MRGTSLAAASVLSIALSVGSAWAQGNPERTTSAFELTQKRKGSCVMPEMPASITYGRVGTDGQLTRSTTPCREDETMCGVSLHTYVNGSHICVAQFRNQESCREGDCKPNWRHRCTDGWWKKTETCLPSELKNAKFDRARGLGGTSGASGLARGERGDSFAKQIESSKAELDAGEKAAAGSAQCGFREPAMSDIVSDVRAAALAGGLADIAQADSSKPGTIDEFIAAAGSLDRAIQAMQGQVSENEKAPSLVNCNASRQHAATCQVNRILARGNRRTLDWLLCHKRTRGQ
jgi:hypothetical protein